MTSNFHSKGSDCHKKEARGTGGAGVLVRMTEVLVRMIEALVVRMIEALVVRMILMKQGDIGVGNIPGVGAVVAACMIRIKRGGVKVGVGAVAKRGGTGV